MTEIDEAAFIHLIDQLKEENEKLREESINLRKLLSKTRYEK